MKVLVASQDTRLLAVDSRHSLKITAFIVDLSGKFRDIFTYLEKNLRKFLQIPLSPLTFICCRKNTSITGTYLTVRVSAVATTFSYTATASIFRKLPTRLAISS